MVNQTEDDALAVAHAAFHALSAHEWPELRQLVDPAALSTLKQLVVSVAVAAVAAQIEDPAGIKSLGVDSMEELQALPSDDVFLRWMAATDSAERLGRTTGVVHVIPPVRYRVLGVVVEDADTAHAVYRAEGFIQGVYVELLRRTEMGWRLSAEGVISRALRMHFTLTARPVQETPPDGGEAPDPPPPPHLLGQSPRHSR
jgi:hypothetical protein